MEGTLEPVYREIIKTFSERAIKNRAVKQGYRGFEEIYSGFMNTIGAQHISEIDDTTRRHIRKVILDNQGAGVQPIAKAIRERMSPPFTRSRAATIARTETHSAASFANHEQHRAFEAPAMMKQWVASNDERTRPAHRAVSGTEIPMDEAFVVGGKRMQHPSDPAGGASEVINCRCVLVYIEPDDVVVDNATSNELGDKFNPQYGLINDEELGFHNEAWSSADPVILSTIKRTSPLTQIKYLDELGGTMKANVGGSYYQPKFQPRTRDAQFNYPNDKPQGLITMEGGKGSAPPDRNSVWRHEYGHHIDSSRARDLVEKVSDITVEDARMVRKAGKVSGASAPQILQDRKKYTYKKAKERENAYIRDNTKANRELIDVDYEKTPERFFKELGKNDSGITGDDLIALMGGKRELAKTKGTTRLNSWLSSFRANVMGSEKSGGWLDFFDDLVDGTKVRHESIMFTDFLQSVSNSEVGWGHTKAYLADKGRRIIRGVSPKMATEIYANYTSLMGSPNHKFWRKLLEIHAPETLKKLDKLTEIISK